MLKESNPFMRFSDTFASVVMFKFIRIFFAIADFHENDTWHMDVETVFSNLILEEDVLMAQSEGFDNLKCPKRVIRLKSSL